MPSKAEEAGQRVFNETATDAVHVPYIVVRFPVRGRLLPADHGYALYAALSRRVAELHRARWLTVELISGVPYRQGVITQPAHSAALNLRAPADRFGTLLPLAGSRIEVEGYPLTLGIPSARPLLPAASLYARFVTITTFTEPVAFLDAARRQLERLGITTGTPEMPLDEQGRFRRRVLKIKNATIVGFSFAVHELNDDDSVKLQAHGVGGRRRMGCGVFNPIRRLSPAVDQRINS